MVAHGGLGHQDTIEAPDGEHCGEHCPFLNRSDYRCSDKLRLDHIDHAFDYCFGDYKACPVYLEQLTERRVRRLCGLLTPPEPAPSRAHTDVIRPNRSPLVQLTLPPTRAHVYTSSGHARHAGAPHAHRYAQHAAGAAVVSPASGV